MRLNQSATLDADPDAVWAVVSDPERVAALVPGVVLRGRDDAGGYLGELTVRFGPTTVVFRGGATIDLDAAARAGTLAAHGADARGRSRVTGTLRFHVAPHATGTALESSAEVQVSGPLGSFAEAGGQQIADQLLAGLAQAIRDEVRPAPEPAVEQRHRPGEHEKPGEHDDETPRRPVPRLRLRPLLVAWWHRLRELAGGRPVR